MIRIERGAEVKPGIWEYEISVASGRLFGKSRQPLLDGCRQIKRALGLTTAVAGVFRNGSDVPDISCVVDAGALLTVSDENNGIRFRKYQEFDTSRRPDRGA